MHIFASDRIGPTNINFPKAMAKNQWVRTIDYKAFCAALEALPKLVTVVLDSSAGEACSPIKCAYAMTEICFDKGWQIPIVMIVGKDQALKEKIEEHIKRTKPWIEAHRGK